MERLERLAMLRLGEDEREAIYRDTERILAFFKQLDELDLGGVEPLFHVTEKEAGVGDDIEVRSMDRVWLEASAYRVQDGFVVGPRTIRGGEDSRS
jgi:aspartyl-tRNA(Asn)/glutamyl-tRNA(Gln) amidotransferase subunit C